MNAARTQPAPKSSHDTDFSPLRKAARPKLIGSPCRSATYTPSATLPNVPEAGELSRTAKYAQLIAIATGAMFASASRLSGASRCTVEYRARLTPEGGAPSMRYARRPRRIPPKATPAFATDGGGLEKAGI